MYTKMFSSKKLLFGHGDVPLPSVARLLRIISRGFLNMPMVCNRWLALPFACCSSCSAPGRREREREKERLRDIETERARETEKSS